MRGLRIGIAFDLVPASRPADGPDDRYEEFDKPQTIEALAAVLQGEGHDVILLGDGREFLVNVLDDRPDFVWNLAEGEGAGRSREARVPAVLEMLGIPHTGSDPLTLAAALDKAVAKTLVGAEGVAVPRGLSLAPGEEAGGLEARLSAFAAAVPFPWLLKPAFEGSSKGIRTRCLVDSIEEAADLHESLASDYAQAVLVEEFIAGDEVTVGIVGNGPTAGVLGTMRVVPRRDRDRFVYSLDLKRDWCENVEYEIPARLDPEIMDRLRRSALDAYRALGCRDVARIDYRVRDGIPYFLEANPLPGLAPDWSDLVILAAGMGLSHADLIRRILDASLARVGLAAAEAWGGVAVSGRGPTVAVLYNDPVLPADHPDAASESDVVDSARCVASCLDRVGFEAVLLAARPPIRDVLARLDAVAPAVIFNMIEGFGGIEARATHVTGLLELTDIPYTGSTVDALSLCLSKGRTKALLRGSGLRTAPFRVVGIDDPVPDWDWTGPAIVKPDAGDGSLGIDQGSVVADRRALAARIDRLRATHPGAVLVEPYLPGPEYNVGLVALPDPVPLPIAEVAFAAGPGSWPILTYAAKWDEGSAEDLASPVVCPAPIDPALAAEIDRLAVAAFRATGCRDYARVDFRLDGHGGPMILEVNPNPAIGPTAGWARALLASGRDYAATIAAIARQAQHRPIERMR